MEVCLLSHEVMLQPLSVPITGSAFASSAIFTRIPNGFPYGPLAFAGENTGLTRST